MEATDSLNGFLSWAWERHHNVLSWYIRPLFLLLFCYFAYKRSIAGLLLTLVALATSMFWFPAPERVDPRVEEFLAFEREWLTGDWTLAKVLTSALVPVSLGALALAFWRRSLRWGLAIVNAMAAGKVFWSVVSGDGTGWVVALPALMGLVVCNAAILYAARRMRRGPASRERAVERREGDLRAGRPERVLPGTRRKGRRA